MLAALLAGLESYIRAVCVSVRRSLRDLSWMRRKKSTPSSSSRKGLASVLGPSHASAKSGHASSMRLLALSSSLQGGRAALSRRSCCRETLGAWEARRGRGAASGMLGAACQSSRETVLGCSASVLATANTLCGRRAEMGEQGGWRRWRRTLGAEAAGGGGGERCVLRRLIVVGRDAPEGTCEGQGRLVSVRNRLGQRAALRRAVIENVQAREALRPAVLARLRLLDVVRLLVDPRLLWRRGGGIGEYWCGVSDTSKPV